jgi:FG-GAP-like repeat
MRANGKYSLLFCGLALICALSGGTAWAQLNPASFAAPLLYSLAGSEVGLTGVYSMAKGDFNGDGIPDVAVAGFFGSNGIGNPPDSIAVYLGNGDGTFKPPVYYPAGHLPGEVVVARLRGKNAPEDLVVVDYAAVSILLGNGDGTFQPPITAASIPTSPTAVAIGDFNGDGKPDLAVSVFGGSGATDGNVQTIAILLGNGNGTFQSPAYYQSANNPYAIAVGDFNNDGKLDLVIMNPEGLYLSLGNGDGTFLPGYLILAEPSTLFSVNPPGPILNGPVSFTVADFNGDGNLDIAANIDGTRVDVLLGTGTGTFAPPVTYLINSHETGFGLGAIVAAKLTNRGKLDLVASTGYGGTLAILYGNGDGTFQTTPLTFPLPEADDQALVVADVNSDGQPDIVVGTAEGKLTGDLNYLTVLLNKGNGDFGAPPALFSVKSPLNQGTATNAVGVTLASLTGNGKLDLVVTDWDLPIEPLANGQLPPLPTINFSTQQVDTHGSISVLAGNGDGTFQTEQQYFVGGRPIAVAVADLTGDGKKDAVVVNAFDNTLSILKGNGDHTFQPAITIAVGTNPNALVLTDFNGDGKPDIAVTDLVDNNVSVLINQSTPGTLNFKTPVTYAVGTYPAGIVARDFNHDGKLDLAVVNSGNFFSANPHTTLSILLGNGDGTFQPAVTQQLWNQYGGDAIVAGNFGRGEIDLAVANFGAGQVMILKGNGDGTFTQAGLYTVGAGPEGMVAADFNGDGKIDIAVNDLNDNTVTMLLGNGDSTFVPAAKGIDDVTRPFGWATWGYPAFIAAGDLTGDGKPDIVVTHLFEAAASVLRNTTVTVPLKGVVSRKVHGSAGTFDVDLTNGHGVECRSGGTSGNYMLLFTFANPLTSVGGANVTSGTGSVATSSTDSTDAHKYIVNLTGVTNAQIITVSLTNVGDSAGNFSSAVSAQMGVLLGDVNASGVVDGNDVSAVQSRTRQSVNNTNFHYDVNTTGLIDGNDVSITQGQTRTSLP